jgi:hypothetical protein
MRMARRMSTPRAPKDPIAWALAILALAAIVLSAYLAFPLDR